MPRQNFTEIVVVLDKSPSMEVIRTGTIAGMNAFIKEQQDTPGDGCWTLIQFDGPHSYAVTYQAIPQEKVLPFTEATYRPGGSGTALIDAVCRAIHETSSRLAGLKEEDYPSGVLFVIMTDGEENSSRTYTRDDMNKLIADHKEKYRWQFAFLGANQDAVAEARKYGTGAAGAMNYAYNNAGAEAVLRCASAGAKKMREELTSGNLMASFGIEAAPDDKLISKQAILPGDEKKS